MAKRRRKERQPEEEIILGPRNLREGELVWGVAHIYASFNDTFVVYPLTSHSPLARH